jgi:hypothetical protein
VPSSIFAQFSIGQTENIEFGQVIVGAQSGTITLQPTGAITASNGLILLGPDRPAEFLLRGPVNTPFVVLLPSTATVSDGFNRMNLRDFETDTPSGVTLGSADPIRVRIGATIDIASNQSPGNYIGTFTITVQQP